jgi:RNA polymerase-binding transcription factor DksA
VTDTTGSGPEPAAAQADGPGDARRVLLLDEQDHLVAEIDELHVGDPTEAHDENFADSGQVAAEQGENMALAGKLREQLDDVGRALDKLDAGTYGLCEVCGEAISADRLEAMPAARHCILHAG